MKSMFDTLIEENLRKEVKSMCNLSQGIKEEGREEGRTAMAKQIIFTMYKNGLTVEQIASAIDKTVEEVEAVIEEKESMLALEK